MTKATVAAALTAATLCLGAGPGLAGDAHVPSVQRLVQEAVAAKAKYVRIPAGTYRVGVEGKSRAHLLFEGARDLEVDGRGVTLVMTQPEHTLVAFRNCSGVRVRGITVDCDPILFTQGIVAAIHPQGGWYDIRIEAGYPSSAEEFRRTRPMSIFDATTREFKSGVADLFLGGVEQRAADTWRVYPVKEVIGRHRFPTTTVQVGDLAAIPRNGGPAWTCRGCENMVFEDITIYQSGSMAFHEHAGPGGTVLRGCRVLRRPGTTRLLSTCADGFHCKNMRRGPVVEDCVFEGMHDDGINIHGMFSRVLENASGTEVLTAPGFVEWAKPGDSVEFYRQSSFASLGVFRLVTSDRLKDPAWRKRALEYWPAFGYRFVYRLKLDREPLVKAGDAMMSLDYVGNGFAIRNNVFRNHRYRSMLIKASSGVIEGNRIYGCSNDAITLTPHLNREGGFARNVVIRGNSIEHVGMLPWHKAAIRVGVYGGGPELACREHRNIVIEDNTIDDVAGNGVVVANASDVQVRGNRISGVGLRRVSSKVPVAIEVRNAQSVRLTGNAISRTPAVSARIAIAESCDRDTVVADGNRFEPAPGQP